MHPIFVLVRKSILMFLHNRAAVVITFIVPIMIIYLVGTVYGLNGSKDKNKGPTGIRLAIVDEAHTALTENLVDGLKQEKTFHIIDQVDEGNGKSRPLTEADARAALKNEEYHYVLIIPADVLGGEHIGIHLKFLEDPRNDVETQMVTGILQKTIFTRAPRLLGQTLNVSAQRFLGEKRWKDFNHSIARAAAVHFGGNQDEIEQRLSDGDFFGEVLGMGSKSSRTAPPDPSLRRLDAASPSTSSQTTTAKSESDSDSFLSKIFNFETEQVAGQQASNPMASRLVGGYAIFFLLFAVSGSASSLFEEKQLGIFQRMLSTSVRRSQILWARFIFGTLLGVAQIFAMFAFGNLMYHLDLGQHFIPVFAVSLAAAAACTSFGLAIAAVAPTQEAAAGLSTLLIMAMGSIGGAWFPVTFLPEFIQNFSRLSIVYWATEGFTDVLWAGKNLLQILPTVGILFAISAGVMALAVWLFSRNAMFD